MICLPAVALAKAGRFHHAGTKLSSNLQSQIGENQLFSSCDFGSPASGGVNKVAVEKRPSTAKSDFFAKKQNFLATRWWQPTKWTGKIAQPDGAR
jgi:hypothetical protein